MKQFAIFDFHSNFGVFVAFLLDNDFFLISI